MGSNCARTIDVTTLTTFGFSAWADRGLYKLQPFEHMLVQAVVSCTQSEDHHLLRTAQLMVVVSLPRLPCNRLQLHF